MSLPRPLVLAVLAVLTAAPALGQPLLRTDVVATVEDDLEITVADLARRAERIFYRGVLDRSERYHLALKEGTLQHLKGLDFFRLGYDRDPAFLAGLGRGLTEELLIAYYEDQYEEPYLNEAAIRAEHEAMGRIVLYRQIVLRKPAGATESELEELQARVQEVRRQLDEGVPAGTLVERYSEDEPSARVGGLMAPVTWERSTESPMTAVVFQLEPGEAVSLETPTTYVIAVGERVEEQPAPPFAAARDRIVALLRGRYADQANRAYYEERQALVDSASVRWNDEVLATVVGWTRTPGFFEGDYPDTVDAFLATRGDAVVFTDRDGELRVSELPRLIREVLTVSGSGDQGREFVQDYLLEAVRADRMAERAEAMGLRDELLRPDTSSPVLAGAFARYYDQRRIEEQIPDTTETALRAFYEAHADSLFYQLATVYTEVIERETEDEIDEVWAQVESGTPFEEVSSRRLLRSFERTRDGEIVTRFNREPPYLGEVAFGLAAGEVAGPVAYDTPAGRRYAVARATRRLDERQLTFDEVRPRIAEAFRQHHRDRLAAEVEAELRARYSVEVDDALWARVLAGSQ